MRIFIFIFALLQAATIEEGFEEFDIDEILEDPKYKTQFLEFLNSTEIAHLKGVRMGVDVKMPEHQPHPLNSRPRTTEEVRQMSNQEIDRPANRQSRFFASNQVLTQKVDPNLGMNLDLSKVPQAEFQQVRKFKHIASLIMYLQKVPILGKYVYYGCYCFNSAQYDLDSGYGQAVDEIDRSCKTFHQCYNCIKKDFVLGSGQANCDGTTRSYRFRGWVDPVTQERQIECLNEIGSCKRSICECDKKLAMDLREHEFTWNIYHHQKWGGFEKESCRIQGRYATNHSSDKKCCGTYPNRFPYLTTSPEGQETGCCNGKTYDIKGPLECCDDKRLVNVGNCVPKTS